MLADGIDFDGTDDFLKTSTTLSFTQPVTEFSVSQTDLASTSQGLWTLAANDTTTGEIVSFYRSDDGFAINAGSTLTTAGSLSYSTGVNYLKTGVYNTTSSVIFINGTSHATGTVGTNNPSGLLLYVGRMNVGASALYLDGAINELVIYDSDQSSNRFKIESNINNHYSTYTAAEDGFVSIWYDQSGNGDNAIALADENEPQIVSAGSLLADGIDFDGSNDQLNFIALNASDVSIFSVVTFDSVAGQERIIGPQTGANEGFGIGNATTGFFRAFGAANSPALNATISADTTTLYSLIRASNTGTFFTNSTASTTFSNSNAFLGASLGGSANPVDGSLKEIIIYKSDQTANRSDIESNIAEEYGITLP